MYDLNGIMYTRNTDIIEYKYLHKSKRLAYLD